MSSPEISEDEQDISLMNSCKPNMMDIDSSDSSVDDEVVRQLFPHPKPLSNCHRHILISSDSDNDLPTSDDEPQEKVEMVANVSKQVTNELLNTPDGKSESYLQFISGVPIQFPFKPYGAQIALMFKVITGIKRSQNALLESPTGSGKTLALLCSALAWQLKEKEAQVVKQNQDYFCDGPATNSSSAAAAEQNSDATKQETTEIDSEFFFKRSTIGKSIYDQVPANMSLTEARVMIHKRKLEDSGSPGQSPAKRDLPSVTGVSAKSFEEFLASGEKATRIPKIYYGTRTHKQIQQVVKELKRSHYSGAVNMSILSSREYSCIRPCDRALYGNKNDMCRELLKKTRKLETAAGLPKETSCVYYNNRQRLFNGGLSQIWDLEDIVQSGERLQACPFYASRQRAVSADIVFCPYNYLIDPAIRSSMQIDLTDEIVILDEAHNIEDVCRESASMTLKQTELDKAVKELELLRHYSQPPLSDSLDFLMRSLRDWDTWFSNQTVLIDNSPVNNGNAEYSWQVEHFVQTLDNHNIGQMQYPELMGAVEHLSARFKDDTLAVKVTQATIGLLEMLTLTMGYLFRDGCKYLDDFKPVLVKSAAYSRESRNGWISARSDQTVNSELSLRLICLNPAIVFASLAKAKCILLTSGTLTPIHSLHSELGTVFPLQVQTDHVIPKERVWVGSIGEWNECKLECTYRGCDNISVQDGLGDAIINVSRVTPHGVLVFVPSYHLRDKLINRWKQTSAWQELNSLKNVFAEARNVRDHNEVMQDYLSCVGSDKGAILFAVYRGKVSEGMDFKDEQARCVIIVGIPYPSMYEMMIGHKMKYNDMHTTDRCLLPSREWLRVQAYRALNQAAGRCVRHVGDWGAVLLVDSRFNNIYFTEHLSKWIKSFLCNNHTTMKSLLNGPNSLKTFMKTMSLK